MLLFWRTSRRFIDIYHFLVYNNIDNLSEREIFMNTETIGKILSVIDSSYNYLLVAVLVLGGLYFFIRTKGAPITMLLEQFRAVTEKPKDKEGVSSFGALMVSTASRVGTGNIVGVSAAICVGGFGAVFWMWLFAVIGSASAFVESTLAQIFKKRGADSSYGGPAYYIETALKCRPLAIIFSVILILTYGVGFNMLASYNLQSTFSSYELYEKFPNIAPWVIGFIVAAVVCFCLFGGGKRMIKLTGILVPVMGIAYIVVALIVICINIPALPSVFSRMFSNAFDFKAIFGGFAGSCLYLGLMRGLFSNEAGVGSAPNASASADVSHPAKQGLVQVLSVFIDTLIICSATAFMCMTSGIEPTANIKGAPYVQQSLEASLGGFGPIFITIAMVLFAFTTLIGNLYYVNQAFSHIFKKIPGKKFLTVYYIVASLLIFVGAGLQADVLWKVADVLMGLMILINMPVICILGRYAFRALKDYRRKRKSGGDIEFKATDIDLPFDVDYWK